MSSPGDKSGRSSRRSADDIRRRMAERLGMSQPEPREAEDDTGTGANVRERVRERAKTARFTPSQVPLSREVDGRPKVLVVDDSQTFRRAIGGMLDHAGFAVETASSGEEAFERCLNESFAVVVSDVTMGALSGVQLCRLLRTDPSTKDVPVVLLTAADDPRSRFWGRNAGAAAYVAKENAREELVAEVRHVLERGTRSLVPVHPRAGRRAQPMERLSQVLDELLFRAVVASEVQRLMRYTHNRREFARALSGLAGEVINYAFLTIRLYGLDGSSSVLLDARAPFPAVADAQALSALEIQPSENLDLDVLASGGELPPEQPVTVKDSARFPIVAAGEILGELRAFGADKRLGGEDRATLQLLASESALLVKNMRLIEETQRLANRDGLTGLRNRRRVSERLEREIERSRRHGTPLCVALCDLDHFKSVNDVFGHNMGDAVLKAVADALSEAVRGIDIVGRWGGEEFIVLLPDTELDGARTVAERVRERVDALPAFPGGPESVTCSIGLSRYEQDANSALFVDRADKALYAAKEGGRNRVEVS